MNHFSTSPEPPHFAYEFMILVLRAYNLSKISNFLAKCFIEVYAIVPRNIAISSLLANGTPFLFGGASEGPFRNLDLCIWARERPAYFAQFSPLILVFSRSSFGQ